MRSTRYVRILKSVPDSDGSPVQDMDFVGSRDIRGLISALGEAGFVVDESSSTRTVGYQEGGETKEVMLPFGISPVERTVVTGYHLKSVEGSVVDAVSVRNHSEPHFPDGSMRTRAGVLSKVEYEQTSGTSGAIALNEERVVQAITRFYDPEGEFTDNEDVGTLGGLVALGVGGSSKR